jgi:hypothetical protein
MGAKCVLCVVLALAISAGGTWGQELPVAFITVVDAHRLLERGTEVLFVDVRSQQEYLARHIKGALSMPLRMLEERYQELPRERLLVLY